MEVSGKIRDGRKRVCLTMDSGMWANVQQAAAHHGITANALCCFIIGEYVSSHQAMMDRFMSMTPEELAKVASALKA